MNGQRLGRKAWSEGSPEQEMRRDEQKPDMRQRTTGEMATPFEARCSQSCIVDPARVHRSAVCLSREVPGLPGKSAEAVVPLNAGRAEHEEMSS